MDLRVKRTKKNICDAFLQLRKEKEPEKITIKELADKACINKATFYLHYRDIYDLADKVEDEAVFYIINNISSPDSFIVNPRKNAEELANALVENEKIEVLFSGSRAPLLEAKIEHCIKERIFEMHPEFQNSLKHEMVLSMLIHGGFHAFREHSIEHKPEEVLKIMGDINECIVENFIRK